MKKESINISSSDLPYLCHHGIKGMKWGVRKGPPYPIDVDGNVGKTSDRITILSKGDRAYRVSSVSNERNSGHAFISYRDKDHETYINHVKELKQVFGDDKWSGYDMTLKVTKDLVAPSKKRAVDELIKACNNNPETRKEYAKAASKMHIFKPSGIIEKQLNNCKSDKEIANVYRDISLAAATSPSFREKYFSKLQRQGFNAMYDGGDMSGKGANTEAPILVFERNGYLDVVKTERITL